MAHILSFLDCTSSLFLADEVLIARAYYYRCSTPFYRNYIHTLPEILTVMDLTTVYATNPKPESDQDRRIRTNSCKFKGILRKTLSYLINASKDYYNAETPVTRPHQFQVPLNDTHQEIIELLYVFAEDACDILNLYLRPPANDARRIILSIATGIDNIREAYHIGYHILAGITRVAIFKTPHDIREDLLKIDYNEETISLYDTPYNGLFELLPTPIPEAIDLHPEYPRDTYVTPITFDEETDLPISSYTVSPTPSRQPDIHLFTTYSPEPNEDTYENIQAGIKRILEVYKNETEDKASIIDIDPDFGEHNFDETHPTYDSLRYVITTYEYESTFKYLQDLFPESPKIHATSTSL